VATTYLFYKAVPSRPLWISFFLEQKDWYKSDIREQEGSTATHNIFLSGRQIDRPTSSSHWDRFLRAVQSVLQSRCRHPHRGPERVQSRVQRYQNPKLTGISPPASIKASHNFLRSALLSPALLLETVVGRWSVIEEVAAEDGPEAPPGPGTVK
jgi:hypothetical protein